MTGDQKEHAVTSHVEALVQLGWRWEGRGLVPTIQNWSADDPKSARVFPGPTYSAEAPPTLLNEVMNLR